MRASVRQLAATEVRDPGTHVVPDGQPPTVPSSIMVGGHGGNRIRSSSGATGHDAMATKVARQLAEGTWINMQDTVKDGGGDGLKVGSDN